MTRTVSSTRSKWAVFSADALLPLAQKCTDRQLTLNRYQHRGHWRPGAETRLSVPKLCLEVAGMRDSKRCK
jgi:hypothetical protein